MGGALIGRDEELALLKELTTGLTSGSAVAIVRGEAGIGKSRLVSAAVAEATAAGLRILSGSCAPLSSAVAYGGLATALRVGWDVKDQGFTSVAAGRAWAFESMMRALGEVVDGGVVLVVEDLHWADASTLDFLAYLSRNLPPSGLLVLLTWRDDGTGNEQAWWLSEQLRLPSVTDLPLRRLTIEETARQLADCSAELVAAVYRRSAGNPYLSAELAAGEATLSTSLRQVLAARLETVPPQVRTAIAATGMLARPLTDDELLVAADGDVASVKIGFKAGLLVRSATDGTTARHPVLAETAFEQLLLPERRRLHARLGEYLASTLGALPVASAVAEVAEQYRLADDRDETMRWALHAARAAETRFAIAEAGHWYAVASALRDQATVDRDTPSTIALAKSAAALLGAAGRHLQAIAVLNEALGNVDTTVDADHDVVSALLARAWMRAHVDDNDGALADLDRAEGLVPPGNEALRGEVLARRAFTLVACSRSPEAEQPASVALQISTRLGDLRTIGRARLVLGLLRAAPDDSRTQEAIENLQAALSIARDLAEPDDIVYAGVGLSYAYGVRCEVDEMLKSQQVVQQELRRLMVDRHWMEDLLEGNLVETLYHLGRWDEALAFQRPATAQQFPALESPLAQIYMARGDLDSAADLQRLASPLDRDDQPLHKLGYVEVQVQLLLHSGRPSEALAAARAATAVIHGSDVEAEAQTLLLAGLEAAAEVQARDDFESLVRLLAGAVAGVRASAIAAQVAAERSRLVGASDPELWRAAARCWQTFAHPYDEARARFRAAEALLASRAPGVRSQAAAELEAALRTAESLRAVPLMGRIRSLAKLARIPLGQTPTGSEPGADPIEVIGLTDREIQVLTLLAEGRTNREIGTALYMSAKTASVHVSHILVKLGVRTRVQAAAVAVRLGLVPSNPTEQ
ncbi:AAA family ATPase [Kribbella sp. CA-247076]|uniref:helix-turn-helix transcriptional regulator n=1 Tax=Kribbella sp. CA-247076 TaxID=3239941 RepID=UPI003D932CC1